MEKIPSFVAECEALYGIHIVHHGEISPKTLKRLRKALCKVKAEDIEKAPQSALQSALQSQGRSREHICTREREKETSSSESSRTARGIYRQVKGIHP